MVYPDKMLITNRKTLSLIIDKNGKLIVRAPKKLSNQAIYDFIEEKESWIHKKQRELAEKKSINKTITEYSQFLYLGQKCNTRVSSETKKITFFKDAFIMPKHYELQDIIIKMKKWYTNESLRIVNDRVEYFAQLMDLNYDTIGITNTKSKWASCSRYGVLRFNLRIAMLQPRVIDYIVIHELSHLIEFNHSKNFYAIIESIMPDYKRQMKYLKEASYLLQLLR